jgi:microcystin-dependent protein
MEGIIGMGKLALGVANEQQWMPCDGRLLDCAGYPELFAILGNQFGGDGKTNFALPKTDPQPAGQFFIMVKADEGGGTKQGLLTQFALWPNDNPPKGWLNCDGRLIQSADYPMFAELAYQGQGAVQPSFNLPAIPDNAGMKFIICVEGRDPRSEM